MRFEHALIAPAFIVLAACGEPASSAPPENSVPVVSAQAENQLPALISAPDAYALAQAGEITLIDIRTPREWRNTGVPEGAALINMRDRDFVDQVLAQIGGDKSTPIALSCATGGRSSNSARKLRELGFTNVSDVSEGFHGNRTAGPGWEARGLPIEPYLDN